MSEQNDALERALRGEATPRVPVWFMRQAGRTDPEYNKLKAEAGLPLEELFRHPELAARISLLPRRIGVDAIIYFQDILTPLAPMGFPFVFDPGPVTENPIRRAKDVERLTEFDVESELGFVGQTFDCIQDELRGALPVLGFAGAPLTLLAFLVEGRSFGDDIGRTLTFLEEAPEAARRALDTLTTMTIQFLQYQARWNLAAVQLFESAAYLLDNGIYHEFALPYQQRIFEALKGYAPTICFARDWAVLGDLDAAGADVISLPSGISLADARRTLGGDRVLQGNLDNRILAERDMATIEEAARACIASGGKHGHIFNLNHGLLRHTPFEHIQRLVAIVHDA